MPRKRLGNEVEMIPELFQIGKDLNDFFAKMEERVVVVISGDLAHTHNHSYPFLLLHLFLFFFLSLFYFILLFIYF